MLRVKSLSSWRRERSGEIDAMTEPPAISWTDLFRSSALADTTLVLRTIKKSGRPFLFVPTNSTLAAHSLSLYPAQTKSARRAKSILRAAFQWRLPVPLERISLPLASKEPFARFLADLVEVPSKSFPAIAVLAGNPHAQGCRFLILLFDERNRPAFVVKAGTGELPRQLVRRETAFLNATSPGAPGLPLVRASFDAGEISAFALNFVPGDSPLPGDWSHLGEVLSAWVNREKLVHVDEILAWQTLPKSQVAESIFGGLSERLASVAFHPTIFHGDLAPWNIKVSPGTGAWTILDWERGEVAGIPGWDWFHYVIQSGVLVGKQPPEELLETLEGFLEGKEFREYSDLAKIRGHERPLVLAYLFYLVNVIKPSEGLATNGSLLGLLAQRWLPV